jgi:uncharacterized membrane protein YqhA
MYPKVSMFHRILTGSRYIILIAVIGSALAALASLLYGGVMTVQAVIGLLQGVNEKASKAVVVTFIEVIDLFLIGTVFYIIALGLYELFIDDRLEMPAWLVIHSLDDLKSKLINSIVVIMGVYFLGALVDWNGDASLLILSGSIALVIGALTLFQFVQKGQNGH